jgi:hypothetical protein
MATITVGENSYIDAAYLQQYADDRGLTISAVDLSVLLINAMDYLNVQSWSGTKTDEAQTLDFPRNDSDTVPTNIEQAQAVLALEWDKGNDLQASVDRALKSEKIDVLEFEYMDNAEETVRYPKVDALLHPYLSSGYGGGNFMDVSAGLTG